MGTSSFRDGFRRDENGEDTRHRFPYLAKIQALLPVRRTRQRTDQCGTRVTAKTSFQSTCDPKSEREQVG